MLVGITVNELTIITVETGSPRRKIAANSLRFVHHIGRWALLDFWDQIVPHWKSRLQHEDVNLCILDNFYLSDMTL